MSKLHTEKYVLSKEDFNYKKAYHEFLNEFSQFHSSGDLNYKVIRFDIDEITLFLLPKYNEQNKLDVGNLMLITEKKTNDLISKIKSKGFSLKKIGKRG